MSLSYCAANPDTIEQHVKDWTKFIDAVVKPKASAQTQLSRYMDNTVLSKDVMVSDFNSASLQYLLWQDNQDVEVSLNVQGVVADACLLPIRTAKNRPGIAKYNNISQFITIVSHPLDTEFNNAIEAINGIYHLMASYNDSLGPRRRQLVCNKEGIRAECRLFSVRKETSGGNGSTVSRQLDPAGIIAKENSAGTHLYGPDNVVDVFQRTIQNGKPALAEISPALVRPGDVVDIAVSFRVIHGKNFQVKLEGIILENSQASKALAKLTVKSKSEFKGPGKRKALS